MPPLRQRNGMHPQRLHHNTHKSPSSLPQSLSASPSTHGRVGGDTDGDIG